MKWANIFWLPAGLVLVAFLRVGWALVRNRNREESRDLEWTDVPPMIRLKIETINFFFYLIGVGLRSTVFVLAAGSFGIIRSHPLQALIVLIICVFLMWRDAQEASDPKDWLKSKNQLLR